MTGALKYLNRIGKRVISANAPLVARGALVEALRRSNISVDAAIEAVQENRRLWPLIPQQYHKGMINLLDIFGGLDWLTAEWLIENGRKDAPQLASLFLGWRKARNWLGRQIEDCKKEIGKLKQKNS